ncbi:uncharacterized protein TrAFT101_000103 [Trichoderma asperellum]|uniref:uncharacterized protein n=1 Tax=Trichoderma asperellum TaxID=101201 RepID=UPI0033209A7E|nr:hypothetical protein TrAFT101_000103 [Trichoderma asperellum]
MRAVHPYKISLHVDEAQMNERNHISVQEQISMEITSLNKTASLKTANNLLASAQAFVIYAILCLFPDENSVQYEINEEKLILDISEISLRLASSGLALHEETTGEGKISQWHDWTMMSAKRRTILTIYMLTWAWSVWRNYPSFYCHELQLMLAPSPKALWQAPTETEWLPLYQKWFQKWGGDGYRIGELLSISPKHIVDRRTEDWLEEVDEFGMLLMSQVNGI